MDADVPVKHAFPGPPVPVPVFYAFDATGFIRALKGLLADAVAGYSIRLTENGSTIGVADQNWAKEPPDGSERWTPDTRMHVASLGKIVTAIAMTRLLGETGISPGTPVIDYLPGYWVKGPNVDRITFADLLAHTSGLAFQSTCFRSDFQWMKAHVAAGTAHRGKYSRQAMNYGLCRVLLATINGNIPVDWTVPPFLSVLGSEFHDQLWDFITIRACASYVANCVFAPAGVTRPGFTHDGWNSGNLASMAGGAAWPMSADELLRVMATFRRGGTIVAAAQAQAMLDDGFGLNQPMAVPTPLGPVYHQISTWDDGSGRWEQGVAFFLPLDMELVILVNSTVGGNTGEQFLYQLVSTAYMAHIVELPLPVVP